MKFKLFIEYDGTNYSGWQKQKNAKTVQGSLIKVTENIFANTSGENKFIDLQGAGRTDSGVHALEQVAHLECITSLSPHILKLKMNDELPSDINILDIEKTSNKFHARHSAVSRQYIYRISKRRSSFEKKYIWWIKDELNVEQMRNTLQYFKGIRDYRSFSEINKKEETSSMVLVEEINITEEDDLIFIRIKASHFLWKMVRRIVGTLVEVGRTNLQPEKIDFFLQEFSTEPAKYTAPPSGLFLEKIYY